MSLAVLDALIPEGASNRPALPMSPLYITVHETGNASKGANAKAHAAYLFGGGARERKVSWHYTVDDERAVRHIPETETAFHAGDGAGDGNRRSIGIELCVNSDGDFAKTKKNAAQLCALILLRRRGLIIVQHNHWNGKNCPERLRAAGWEEFLETARREYFSLLAEKARDLGFINSPGYWEGVLRGNYPAKRDHLEELFSNIAARG